VRYNRSWEPAPEPLEVMAIFVRVLSILGLIGYGVFAWMFVIFAGMSPSSTSPWTGPTLLYFGSPFIYLLYCLLSSMRGITGWPLLISGIIAHLVILPVLIDSLRDELSPLGLAGVLMAGAWSGMYNERRKCKGV